MVVSVETPTKLLFVLGTPKQKALFISKTKRKMKTLNEVAAAIKEDEKTPFNTETLKTFIEDYAPCLSIASGLNNVIYNYIMAHDKDECVDMITFVNDVWWLMRLRNIFIKTAIDNGQATHKELMEFMENMLKLTNLEI